MYQATYYDGQTSNPFSCVVYVIENAKLSIRYYNEYNEIQDVIWDVNKIQHSEFSGIGKSSFIYGTFPHQTLELDQNSEINSILDEILPRRKSGFGAFSNELVNGGLKGIFIVSILFLSAILSLYFGVLPYLAERLALNLPIEVEEKLGKEIYDSMISNYKVDEEKTKNLNKFAKNIDFESPYNLKFVVVDENQVNAFALPGGYVVVYDKILRKMDKPEQLAGLLSHEVSHINQRHSLKGMANEFSGSIFLSIIFGGSGFSELIVSQAHNLNSMKFSRNLEKEADLKGLKILQDNKINQYGMVELMEKLKKEEEKAGLENIPSYLSTHPIGKTRIKYLKAAIVENDTSENIKLNETWQKMN